jgi:hypothetical protein
MTRTNILITGASSGLGAQMAREFAAKGRNLALCARRTDRLEDLRAELLDRHPALTVNVHPLDVTDTAAVFDVFRSCRTELGSLDRVIVNAGSGDTRRLGTGNSERNLRTAQTNYVAALAQCEAAMEIFRSQNAGHLVLISSMSAVRGMPGNLTVYASTKAGLAALGEGLRGELLHSPITVSTIFPGWIRTELNENVRPHPLMVSTEVGVAAMIAAIDKERPSARVPAWPWVPIGLLMKMLPLRAIAKLP